MIDALTRLDADILLFLNSFHNSYFDSVMSMFSGRYIWIPMYVALLYMFLRRYPAVKVLMLLLGIALSITLADQICASLIRPVVQRLRPSNIDNPLSAFVHIVNGYRGGAYGFPSCHAANSFALAIFAAMAIGRRPFTWFIILWAVINSCSRIYLGVHFPGDLLVGAIIGSIVGMLCYRLAIFSFNAIARQKDHIADATPVPAECRWCNSVERYFKPLPICLKELGAMGFVAFITIMYILLASVAAA